MKLIALLMRHDLKWQMLLVSLSLASAALSLFIAQTPEKLADSAANGRVVNGVLTAIAAMALLLLIDYLKATTGRRMTMAFASRLRASVTARLLRSRPEADNDPAVVRLDERLTRHVDDLASAVRWAVVDPATHLVTVSVCLAFVFNIDRSLGLLACSFYGASLTIVALLGRDLGFLSSRANSATARYAANLRLLVHSLRDVRSESSSAYEEERLRPVADDATRAVVNERDFERRFNYIGHVGAALSVAVFYVAARELVDDKSQQVSVSIAAALLFEPLRRIAEALPNFQKVNEHFDELWRLTKLPQRVAAASMPPRRHHAVSVTATNVSLMRGGVVVLDDLSLRIEPGAFVLVFGGPGSGKSALIDVLGYRVAVSNGSIKLDDQDVASLPGEDLAATVGCITSEPFITAGSLRLNVAYSLIVARDAPTSDRAVMTACADAGLGDDLPAFAMAARCTADEGERLLPVRAALRDVRLNAEIDQYLPSSYVAGATVFENLFFTNKDALMSWDADKVLARLDDETVDLLADLGATFVVTDLAFLLRVRDRNARLLEQLGVTEADLERRQQLATLLGGRASAKRRLRRELITFAAASLVAEPALQRRVIDARARVRVATPELESHRYSWNRWNETESIFDNIVFGRPRSRHAASLQEVQSAIWDAARSAGVYEELFAQALNLSIEPGGTNLTRQQRMKIAIARAFAKQPRLIMVDDAAATLDADSLRHVLQSLDRVRPAATVILTSCDLIAGRFDAVFRLNRGRISNVRF